MTTTMEDLIPLVNQLQDVVFNTIGSDTIDLPQIVVVGSQSSGKSSVLENIVGRDFLPRGSGIVTRRPLVLQLVNISTDDVAAMGESQEYGEFLHVAGRKYLEFAEIRREIESETARVAGQNKGIAKSPIHLKIFSPHVLNLTLVDLPGLTKIPVGDQPTDIEKQIRLLVLEYISKPNCVILAVSPANVDIANSESLKLARQVDPQGRRTIGVLTKLDLMDAGTNALEILTGRIYPLKLGFIGVINRSQQDIVTNKPMAEALKAEVEFFKTHIAYRTIAHRCGTKYLAKTLNTTLMNHIRDKLPDMKARLNTLMGQTQQELASYGDHTFTGKTHQGSLILKLMTKFATDFVASIDGTSLEISTKELCGGARIYYIFNNVFGTSLESINPTSNLSSQDIRTAIRNSTGPRPSLFVPEIAFDLLVKPQIRLLEPPSQRCVELVYEELTKICHNCTNNELQRFPRLHAKLIEVVSDLLRERLGPTLAYIESLIAIQRAYINTNHPNFIGSVGAMSAVEQRNDRKNREQSKKYRISTPNGVSDEKTSRISNDDAGTLTVMNGNNESSDVSQGGFNGQVSNSLESDSGEISSGGMTKESFLMYFFGGATKSDRPALPESESFPAVGGNVFDMQRLEKQMDHLQNGQDDSAVLTEREEIETQLIRSLIASYFSIVRQEIQDLVPKAIMHLLVNYCRETVQNRLVEQVYKDELFNELLFEDESLVAERQKCEAMLDVYRKAFSILNEAAL